MKPGDVVKGVIVRTKKVATRREDGSYVRFDRNALVILDKADDNPRKAPGSSGPSARELRGEVHPKILSLAAEVV